VCCCIQLLLWCHTTNSTTAVLASRLAHPVLSTKYMRHRGWWLVAVTDATHKFMHNYFYFDVCARVVF
jgi:hypothetical protein